MRRETLDLIGSGLLLAALVTAIFAVLAPTPGASTASSSVPGAGAVASSTAHERGLVLFYAKGCVTCHRMTGVEGGHEIGPDLTGIAARAGTTRPGMSAEANIEESLRTPSAFIAATPMNGGNLGMPDLGLGDAEIAALVMFLLRAR